MKSPLLLFLIICSLPLQGITGESLRAPMGAALPHSTTTAEQRLRIIAVTRALETSPFGETANRDREWALSLIDHSPDIFPGMRERLFGEIAGSELPDRRAIYAQFVFGFVAFQLEHPDRADDAVAVYQAAVHSALRVYRLAVKRNNDNRIAILDSINEFDPEGLFVKDVEALVDQSLVPEAK